MSDKFVYRRQRIVTHDPGTMLCTVKHPSSDSILAFGVARKDPNDKVSKAFGKEVAQTRAKRATKINITNVWNPEDSIPDRGLVHRADMRAFLSKFYKSDFVGLLK